jgi:hypothetical protein
VSAQELLRRLVEHLEAAEIPFMLTGSMAAAWHGAGRATMDIDLVIEADAARLHRLVESLSGPDVYISREAAAEALARETMFNVVDATSGWKVDLIIRKSRPFSRTEFFRRQRVAFEGMPLWVASLEDVIVSKLEWAKLGGSVRQLEDVVNLLRVAEEQIDRDYLDRWITELGLEAQWRAVSAMT